MRLIRLNVAVAAILAAGLALAGCDNTIRGAGKDISDTGNAVQGAANDVAN